jgi:hypothetical protein
MKTYGFLKFPIVSYYSTVADVNCGNLSDED